MGIDKKRGGGKRRDSSVVLLAQDFSRNDRVKKGLDSRLRGNDKVERGNGGEIASLRSQ